MIVEKGASLNGGTVTVNAEAILTLGENAGSPASTMGWDTTFNLLAGDLIAPGGFNMSNGLLRTAAGRNLSIITVDGGNAFQLSGGTIEVTSGGIGELEIDGTFTATGGTIQDDVDTSTGDFGIITVKGDVNLSTQCAFSTQDEAMPPQSWPGRAWNLFSWTGTRTGTFSVDLAPDWTWFWDDTNKQLVYVKLV